jgi:hypothetical protein
MTLRQLGQTDEEIEDLIAALITGGPDVSVSYDDANSNLGIDVATTTDEEIEDVVNALLATDSNLNLTYNDSTDTLTVSLDNNISVDSLNNADIATASADTVPVATGTGALAMGTVSEAAAYQDVTNSRSVNTTFQNTTGSDLLAIAQFTDSGGSINMSFNVGDTSGVGNADTKDRFAGTADAISLFAYIPEDVFYFVQATTGSLIQWDELELNT